MAAWANSWKVEATIAQDHLPPPRICPRVVPHGRPDGPVLISPEGALPPSPPLGARPLTKTLLLGGQLRRKAITRSDPLAPGRPAAPHGTPSAIFQGGTRRPGGNRRTERWRTLRTPPLGKAALRRMVRAPFLPEGTKTGMTWPSPQAFRKPRGPNSYLITTYFRASEA